MKIGLVSAYDYSFPGGVSVHISHLARHFLQKGHTVKVVAPCSQKAGYFDEEVTAVGRPLPIPYGGSIARTPLSPWLPAQTREILRKERFDIVHIHEPFVPMVALSALLQSNSVTVGTFHACYEGSRGYWAARPLLRRWLSRLDGKIAVSKPAMEFVSRYLPGDYQIIPNGIDIEHFSPKVPPIEGFNDSKLNILFVGRLEKRKGVDCLLAAYGEVKRQFPDVRLIVVGPGTRLRSKYERLVHKNKLTDVVFTGFVSASDLPRYYQRADIFCAPASKGESFGIILLEAMASGKPVVASSIEGYASLLNDGEEGLLFPVGDVEALAQALLQLLNSKSLRHEMGEKGRNKAEKYSWASVTQRVLDYYISLLNKAK